MANKPKIRFKGFDDAWEQRKLGEYVSIISGEAPSKFEEGTELYVKVDDLNYNDKYVVDTQNKVAEHSTVKRVTKGSVVFPKRGAAIMTNKVRIIGIDSYMDTNMMALTSEKLDSEFLYNIISKEGLYKIADTSTIPQINNKHVEPYEVTIPSLDEQRRIGAYFKQLDHLITLHQRKCDQMKELKKYMLTKMFPQNGSKVPEIRFYGFTDDWEQRKLGEIATETYGGGTPKTSNEEFWKGDIPWIQSSDLIDECLFDVRPRKCISQEAVSKSATKLVPQNSIAIVTRVGVGKLAFMPFSYATSQDFLSLSGLKIDPEFTVYALFKMMQSVSNEVQGTSIKGVTKDELLAKKIIFPSCNEQKKIGAYLHNLDHLITLHQSKCENLKNLKKYMLRNMFV